MAGTLTDRAARVYDIAEDWPGITKISGHYGKARDIANSSTISEHSYGNALDIYGSRDGLDSLAQFLDQNRQAYQIRIICYDPGPGRRYQTCTTKHTDHIHLDFSPNCGSNVSATGTPSETARRCNDYQEGKNVTGGGDINPETGLTTPVDPEANENWNPLSGITEGIENAVMTVALIGIGAVLIIAGIVIVVKDTDTFKATKSAVVGAVTRGAAK